MAEIDFTEDEEEGIDFTPDPARAVAAAPPPILPPPNWEVPAYMRRPVAAPQFWQAEYGGAPSPAEVSRATAMSPYGAYVTPQGQIESRIAFDPSKGLAPLSKLALTPEQAEAGMQWVASHAPTLIPGPSLTPGEREQLRRGEITPSTDAKALAGFTQGAYGTAEALTSPMNLGLLVGTAGMSEIPVAARALSGAFAADMASHVPEMARNLGEAVGSNDPEAITRAATELAATGAFTATAGTHAAIPRRMNIVVPESVRELAREPAPAAKAPEPPKATTNELLPKEELVVEPAKAEPAPVAEAPSPLPEQFRTKPIAETADLVKGVTSEELAAYKGNAGGGATGFMWDLGAKAKTAADVAALRKMGEQASAETKALMAAGDSMGAMRVIGRQPAEAYEYATGVKLDGTPKWETFEKMAERKGKTYKPSVPDPQYLKAKGGEPVETQIQKAEGQIPITSKTAVAEPALGEATAAPLPADVPSLARERIANPEMRPQIDAKIEELGTGVKASQLAVLRQLPPVPAGHVRLFHGEGGPQGGGTGGAFYTSNIAKASTFGPDVSWVDLPAAKAQAAFAKAKASAFAGGDNFILEAADINRSQKINQKVEPPTHVLDEPAAPVAPEQPAAPAPAATPPAPRGIAASVRGPGGLSKQSESGAVSLAPVQAAVAGAKAARDTVGNVVRFYSEPLTERLASEGGTNAKGFANMSNEIAQRSKELFGSLTPTLDPALEATGKMNRTTTWLNDIAPTNQKWGYRNAVKAVEGPIGSVPADHVPTVNQLKAANLAIGQLPQGVVPGYRASGRYQRSPTDSFVDAIRSQKGPVYETAMRALATENRMPISRVKDIFRDIKAEFDQPGSKQTIHKIAQEFQRHFPKFPTDLKVSTPLGEMWVPILHAKPFDYLLNSAQKTAQRVAFLERVPTDTLPQLRKDVVAELKDPAAFDDLVRSLHGLPVNEPLRLFAPGTMQELVASGANRVLTDVFSSLKLTASAIYNIPETVLGNTPAFFGWRNFLEGAKTLKQRHDRLETLGAINRAIYNFSIDPKAPIRSTLAMFRQGVRKATAQQFFNEMQEKLAASTAQVFSERAQGRVLSAHEQSLFTETATAMGFARPAANSMARGTGTAEQYGDFVKRASSFATGGNIQPAELSRFGANRVLNGLFRFQSYPIMKLNAFRKAYVNFAEAVESKNAGRIKASSEQMAKFLFNTTAQGAATAFVAAFLTGRGGGVEQTAEDASEDIPKFIFDSVASGLGGPVAAINYAVGTGKAGDLVNPKNINAGSTFPGSIYLELKQLFNTEGPYEGMSLKQAAKKYSRTKIPAGRMINRALEEAGLISGSETSRNNLFRLYDKWLGKQTDPKIKADYERRKGRDFGDSKYDMLDAALADRDEARAIKAITALKAEGQKNKDILDRMRPFVGEGINSRTKPLFQGEPRQFRNSLNAEQRAEYQKAIEERKAIYQEFLKAWRKRDTAPKSGPAIDFVPDAGQ